MKVSSLFLTLGLLLVPSLKAADPTAGPPARDGYPDPARFEKAIREFEALDAKSPPPSNPIVALGSSTIRLWAKELPTDLAPLTIIPRGFGGSNMYDALHYADRIAINYKPRAILLYEGDNDLAQGISPEIIRDTFLKLVAKVHAQLPETRIYVISIKPSEARSHLWLMGGQKANRLLAEACAKDKRLLYLDITKPMLVEGKPRPDIFLNDHLHLNREGYLLWTKTLKPILHERELPFEPKPAQ